MPRTNSALLAWGVGCALALLAAGLTVAWWGKSHPRRDELTAQYPESPGVALREELLWGQPSHGLYPVVDSPRYVEAREAEDFLNDDEPVFVLMSKGQGRVFPKVLMTSYHVVNDAIEEEPIAVTSCLLAGSTMLLHRRVEDQVLSLGLTGQLYCGNSVLYDRETGTDWLQLNGEPLRGKFWGKARLAASPLEPLPWGRVKNIPGLLVLAPILPIEEYRLFQQEMERSQLGQRVVAERLSLDPRLLPYTRGFGLRVQGETRFYPAKENGQLVMTQDHMGGWSLLVFQGPLEGSCRVFRRRCRDQILEFQMTDHSLVDRNTTSRWNTEGLCLEGPLRGERLERASYSSIYWFVWSALYPETSLGS